MAQCVRTDIFVYPGQFTQVLDDVEYHLACEFTATAVEEKQVFATAFHCQAAPVGVEIFLYFGKRHR